MSCEDLSLGIANNLNFIDIFLTRSNRNQVVIIGIATKNNKGFSEYINTNVIQSGILTKKNYKSDYF